MLGALPTQMAIKPAFHAHNDYLHSRPLLDALDQGFDSVEADVFLVNEETTSDELENVLENYVDGLHDYGSGDSLVRKCCDILRDSILFVRNEEGELGDTGKEEDHADKMYDEFERRFTDDYSTNRIEYGEGTTSGVLKLDGKPVFEYESHDDGYGFGGELSNIDHILSIMLDLSKR